MPIYLSVPDIDGSVTAEGYEGCVSLTSATFEVTREMQQGVGRGRNRSWTAPVVDKIQCSKIVDDATGKLFAWSLGALPTKDGVKIHFMKLGLDAYVEYMRWELEEVILSQFTQTVDDSPEEKGTEDFQLSYLKVTTHFFELDEGENLKKTTKRGYDVAKARPL